MSRLRFEAAKDLFKTFPTAISDVGVEPSEERSLDFIKLLSNRRDLRAGLSFCAYLLPRREAVWWGCQCLRQNDQLRRGEDVQVAAAEAWVREPDEPNRLRAFDLGTKGDTKSSGTWMCLAAGWAGGTLPMSTQNPVVVPQHLTAQAVRVALILASHGFLPWERAAMQSRWLADGVHIAQTGPMQ